MYINIALEMSLMQDSFKYIFLKAYYRCQVLSVGDTMVSKTESLSSLNF